jgi:hypothetical protein
MRKKGETLGESNLVVELRLPSNEIDLAVEWLQELRDELLQMQQWLASRTGIGMRVQREEQKSTEGWALNWKSSAGCTAHFSMLRIIHSCGQKASYSHHAKQRECSTSAPSRTSAQNARRTRGVCRSSSRLLRPCVSQCNEN